MPCEPQNIDGQPHASATVRRGLRRKVIVGCIAGLAFAGIVEAGRVLLGTNFHTVIPGRVYRCAQMSGPALEQLIRAHHIRTVVNLRGCCAPWPWYMDECRASFRASVSQEDICFSAGRLPSVAEVRRLVDMLDHTEYPIVMHCRRGSDRTGLASTIVLLLQTDIGLDEAWRQLGPRYGHVPLGRPACLHRFFQLYRDWLQRENLDHVPAHFRQWVQNEYCPGECSAIVTALDLPATLPVHKPFALRMRALNTSHHPWRLQPEANAGIHARFVLWNDADQQLATGRSGLFHEKVAPGRSIDLTLAFPALKEPGRYRIMLDMVDEQQCWFFQTGSRPLELELEARE